MAVPPPGWSRWLSARMFPPVAVATGLAAAFLAGWQAEFGAWTGPRLRVNLALAWVPYLCSLWAVWVAERRPHSLRPALPVVLWFVFFPNAPYLVTDWLYLDSRPVHAHLWYSIGLLTAFSLCGLLLATASLYLVHTLVSARLGRGPGWALVGVSVGLSGLGVYLGRFVRLNSWEVVTHPSAVVRGLEGALLAPENRNRELGFTLGFAALLLVCYYVFLCVRQAPLLLDELLARGDRLEADPHPDGAIVLREGLAPDARYVHCRYCNSADVAPSRPRNVGERLLRHFRLRPYRCLLCSRRFFGSMRLMLKIEGQRHRWA